MTIRVRCSNEVLNQVLMFKGPREVSVKVAGKNLDWNPVKFDTQVTLSYVTPAKKDAILHAVLKKVPKDGKWIIKGEVS